MERILGAARELLDEGSFEGASVPLIVDRAGVSVGALYCRFRSKDGLYHVLHEQFTRDAGRMIAERIAPGIVKGLDLETRVHRVVGLAADLYEVHRGVFRAVFFRTRYQGDPGSEERARDFNQSALAAVQECILSNRATITHPDPEHAIRLGLTVITACLREELVFRGSFLSDEDRAGGKEALVRDLGKIWLGILRPDERGRPTTP